MKLTVYKDISEFMIKAERYMETNEAMNNLMLGICRRLANNEMGERDPYLALVEKEDQIAAVAVMTPPRPLLLYSNGGDEEKRAWMDAIIDELIASNINIPGVIAPADLAADFSKLWSKRNCCESRVEMNLRVYKLEYVNQLPKPSGIFRVCEQKDLDFIARGIFNFEIDASLNMNPNLEDAYASAQKKIDEGSVFLWDDNGPVAMAGRSRQTKNGIVVSLVYTPKDLRGRGYATACVAALSQKLLDEGFKFCALFTDLANPVSNSIYMKIGYEPLGDFDNYDFIYEI